jgi:hypothetical protein
MSRTDTSAAYAQLLADLVEVEPHDGYNSAADIKLTNAQAAVVVREFPDVIGEALVGHENNIAAVMVASGHPRADLATSALCHTLFGAITGQCARYILSDLKRACDDAAEGRRVDARFERVSA